jgi:hypothetical protein
VAKGCWRIQKEEVTGRKRDDFNEIPGKADVVVTSSEFARVQDLLIGRAIAHRNPERVHSDYVFLGLLRCGEKLVSGEVCGANFWATPTTKGPGYNVYRHRQGVGCRAGDLDGSYCASERLLCSQLAAFFARAHLPPEAVEVVGRYLTEQEAVSAPPDRERLLRGYKSELERIDIGFRRGAYGEDSIEAERLWDQERQVLQAKIPAIPALPTLPDESVRARVIELFQLWQTPTRIKNGSYSSPSSQPSM